MEQITDTVKRIVIVGTGHGGVNVAVNLRKRGFEGEIVLIGEEKHIPYNKPPLSKSSLKETVEIGDIELRPLKYYQKEAIDLQLGKRVCAVDRKRQCVVLDDGGIVEYSHLILATGASPRKLDLPGGQLNGIFSLRNYEDAIAIRNRLMHGARVAIIGGGYIGLEVAASVIQLGGEAVIVERESRVLERVASEELSRFFEHYHRTKGVKILTSASLAKFTGDSDGYVAQVELSDQTKIDCDLVLVGIGAVPNEEIARGINLTCDGGIVVDQRGKTSDPLIYALGDVTNRPLQVYGGKMFRLESVPNTVEQGKQIAAAILGLDAPSAEVPWFWSDQYDIKLQIAGIGFDVDDIVVRGEQVNGKFSVFHFSKGRLVCVEAINSPQEFIAGKRMILDKAILNKEKLKNTQLSVKEAFESINSDECQ